MEFRDVNWIHLAQYKNYAGCCEHGKEVLDSINARKYITVFSRTLLYGVSEFVSQLEGENMRLVLEHFIPGS